MTNVALERSWKPLLYIHGRYAIRAPFVLGP